MTFRSNPLTPILEALEGQALRLSKARHAFLIQEAERKHFEASLVKGASGSSQAERITNAHAQAIYAEFHRALADLETRYNFELLKFSILEKDYFAQLAMLKLDHSQIIKGVGGDGSFG